MSVRFSGFIGNESERGEMKLRESPKKTLIHLMYQAAKYQVFRWIIRDKYDTFLNDWVNAYMSHLFFIIFYKSHTLH